MLTDRPIKSELKTKDDLQTHKEKQNETQHDKRNEDTRTGNSI